MKQRSPFAIALAVSIVASLLVGGFGVLTHWHNLTHLWNLNAEKLSFVGAYLGGILGPIFTFATILFFGLTWKRSQESEAEKQSVDLCISLEKTLDISFIMFQQNQQSSFVSQALVWVKIRSLITAIVPILAKIDGINMESVYPKYFCSKYEEMLVEYILDPNSNAPNEVVKYFLSKFKGTIRVDAYLQSFPEALK